MQPGKRNILRNARNFHPAQITWKRTVSETTDSNEAKSGESQSKLCSPAAFHSFSSGLQTLSFILKKDFWLHVSIPWRHIILTGGKRAPFRCRSFAVILLCTGLLQTILPHYNKGVKGMVLLEFTNACHCTGCVTKTVWKCAAEISILYKLSFKGPANLTHNSNNWPLLHLLLWELLQ